MKERIGIVVSRFNEEVTGRLLLSCVNTLKANGLVEVERIADISAWLVANKASLKMKRARLKALVDRLAQAVG